jgi:hypothetical protein
VVRSGVDRAALAVNRLWAPIDLSAMQSITADDPAAAAAEVKRLLRPASGALRPSPLDLLADDIARCLRDCGETRVREAIDCLGEPVAERERDPRRQLAQAIATAMLRRHPPTLGLVADALRCLERTAPVEQVLDAIAYLWVELEAAAGLLRASWRDGDYRDTILACRHPVDTLRDYVVRAHAPWRPPLLILLNDITGGRQAEDIAWQLRAELRQRFARFAALSDAELDDALNAVDRLYVGLSLPPPGVVEQLQARYQHVTFVFHVPPEHVPGASIGGVEWLSPPLDPELEAAVARDRTNALFKLAA